MFNLMEIQMRAKAKKERCKFWENVLIKIIVVFGIGFALFFLNCFLGA